MGDRLCLYSLGKLIYINLNYITRILYLQAERFWQIKSEVYLECEVLTSMHSFIRSPLPDLITVRTQPVNLILESTELIIPANLCQYYVEIFINALPTILVPICFIFQIHTVDSTTYMTCICLFLVSVYRFFLNFFFCITLKISARNLSVCMHIKNLTVHVAPLI